MKKCKYIFIVLFILFFILAFASAYASAEWDESDYSAVSKEWRTAPVFELPISLQIIDDGAFEGTAIEQIKLPETVTTIGENAFANIRNLRSISIPTATTSIGENAFAGSTHVTIIAAPKSFARTWAKKNRVPFSPIVAICASTSGTTIVISTRSIETAKPESIQILESDKQSKRFEETRTIGNRETIENHVQGRAPPLA